MARITVETLIKNVVDKLRASRTGAISSVVQNGNEYTLNTLKTFDIKKGNFISVLGFSVYVVEVVENVSITVETSNDLTTAVKWNALQPYFYYGDPVDMNNEITAGNNDQDTKYPAVIMFEVKRSKYSIQRSRSSHKIYWDYERFTPRRQDFRFSQFLHHYGAGRHEGSIGRGRHEKAHVVQGPGVGGHTRLVRRVVRALFMA